MAMLTIRKLARVVQLHPLVSESLGLGLIADPLHGSPTISFPCGFEYVGFSGPLNASWIFRNCATVVGTGYLANSSGECGTDSHLRYLVFASLCL
jgi:hypothetical protein